MRTLRFISFVSIIIGAIAFAQEPNVVWQKTYGGNMGDKGYSIQATQDGGFIIAGSTYSFGAGNTDIYLIKTDAFGNVEWQRTFGGANYDEAWSVIQTSDLGYVVTGSYDKYGAGDIYLIKIAQNGNPQWVKEINLGFQEWGQSVIETADGGFAIVGGQVGPDPGQVLLVKADNLGNVTWTKTYGLTNQIDCGFCIQQVYENYEYKFVIAGLVYNPNTTSRDVWLLKTDEYGNLLWEKRFGYNDSDDGKYVTKTNDQGYILCGTVRYAGAIFLWLIKTDVQGNLVWEKKLRPTTTSAARGYIVKQTGDGGYIAVGEAMLTTNWDVYIVKVNSRGNIEWQKTIDYGNNYDDHGYSLDIIANNEYIIAGATFLNPYGPPYYDLYLVKLGPMLNDTDDPLSLAYNGNRHLVREPNTERLHLVYTRLDSVIYQYSSDGGINWTAPLAIGEGKFPAITLSSSNLPSVTWTDDIGGLWYKRKINLTQWSVIYHLYDPWAYWQARLNSPPSIAITPHTTGDSVHILCTMHSPANGPINWVGEYAFRIDQPLSGSFSEIEGGAGATAGPIRYNPSIARSSIDNSLHAVWQRADTICYATREIGQNWQNWGPRFEQDGLRSAHPFVECYGDMVYVVWEHKVTPWLMEDVYKGWTRSDIQPPNFYWDNLSRTPNTPSRYPVNASGLFTVFQDSPYPPINGPEVYYKVHPEDEPFNISQTIPGSYYPQSVARFVGTRTYLYTAWQDGDNVPYEIKFKKLQYIPMELPAPVYLTSINGNEIPSPYLVARDSFISNWQIPVDIGYQTITYRFPLEPGYRYKIKAVAYHETSGQWREWVKIDGKLKHLIKYNAYEPESLQFWIPPAFYKDGKIDVVFERISGDFATAGSIYIYQYEYEEEATELASGPMAQESHTLNNIGLAIFPNPFRDKLNIRYTISDAGQGFSLAIKIYDVSGGLIKQFNNPSEKIIWDGRDEYGRKVTPGVYFLKVDNPDTKQTFTHKLIKLE